MFLKNPALFQVLRCVHMFFYVRAFIVRFGAKLGGTVNVYIISCG